MNVGSKIVVGLLFLLGMLQLEYAWNTFAQFGRINWFKILAGIVFFTISISGYYWIKRNPHRS